VGPGEEIASTSTIKRTVTPRWNEAFQVNVYDAETEVIVIRVANGKRPKVKGKDFLGEVHFPLRSSARDFDSPSYQLRWYPLQGSTGSILVFIQYHDSRPSQAPTNFKHESHLGWNADGSYDLVNIPKEWKAIFHRAGLTKKDLAQNPSLAENVFQIMNHYSTMSPQPSNSVTSSNAMNQNISTYYSDVPANVNSYDNYLYHEAPHPPASSLPSLPIPNFHPNASFSTYSYSTREEKTEKVVTITPMSHAQHIPPPPPPPRPPSPLSSPQQPHLLQEIRSKPSLRPVRPLSPRNITEEEKTLEVILRGAMKCIRDGTSDHLDATNEEEWE
jgi:hypothetical protein